MFTNCSFNKVYVLLATIIVCNFLFTTNTYIIPFCKNQYLKWRMNSLNKTEKSFIESQYQARLLYNSVIRKHKLSKILGSTTDNSYLGLNLPMCKNNYIITGASPSTPHSCNLHSTNLFTYFPFSILDTNDARYLSMSIEIYCST